MPKAKPESSSQLKPVRAATSTCHGCNRQDEGDELAGREPPERVRLGDESHHPLCVLVRAEGMRVASPGMARASSPSPRE
jgi:hypothetical protein